MPVPADFDYRNYAGNFRIGAESALPVARRLDKAVPEDATPLQRRYCGELLEAAQLVQKTKSDRDRLAPEKIRPIKQVFQNDWGAFHGTLEGTRRLRVGTRGARAGKLSDALLPDGLAFAVLEADEAWSEAERLLGRIEDEELESEIVEVIGAEFLTAIKKSTRELGEAIGVGRTYHEVPSSTGLQAALSELGRCIGRYVRTLLADVDERDPASVERFLRAVAPLDRYRAARSGGVSESEEGGEEDEEPAAPIAPPVEQSDPVSSD